MCFGSDKNATGRKLIQQGMQRPNNKSTKFDLRTDTDEDVPELSDKAKEPVMARGSSLGLNGHKIDMPN